MLNKSATYGYPYKWTIQNEKPSKHTHREGLLVRLELRFCELLLLASAMDRNPSCMSACGMQKLGQWNYVQDTPHPSSLELLCLELQLIHKTNTFSNLKIHMEMKISLQQYNIWHIKWKKIKCLTTLQDQSRREIPAEICWWKMQRTWRWDGRRGEGKTSWERENTCSRERMKGRGGKEQGIAGNSLERRRCWSEWDASRDSTEPSISESLNDITVTHDTNQCMQLQS